MSARNLDPSRTCAHPGDQEHDHAMCEDVNEECAELARRPYPEIGKLVAWSDYLTSRTGFVVGPFSWMPADRVAVRATDGALYSVAPDRLTDQSCPTCQATRAQDHAPACDRRPAHVWVAGCYVGMADHARRAARAGESR